MDFQSFIAKLQESANKKDKSEGLYTEESEVPDFLDEEVVYDENDPDWPFNQFSQDFKILGCPTIDTIHVSELTPLIFYRDYVARNRPVIIEGAIDDWPAMSKWSNEYLAEAAGDDNVTIDFTPDGRGDAIVMDEEFVTPFEEKMKFRDFLQLIQREKKLVDINNEDYDEDEEENTFAENIIPVPETLEKYTGVPYCQHQNSSFTTEFQFLREDAGQELAFASEAFGTPPDAVNFWMGDTRAISTMHADPYENIYCVVAGEKRFTICPPSDTYWLTRKSLPKSHWVRVSDEDDKDKENGDDEIVQGGESDGSIRIGDFKTVRDDTDDVEWIDIDVDYPNHNQKDDPLLKHITKFNVPVTAGQVLYLPALWFHGVRQKGRTIAVNFWYDISYDVKWMHTEFMRQIAEKMKKQKKSKE